VCFTLIRRARRELAAPLRQTNANKGAFMQRTARFILVLLFLAPALFAQPDDGQPFVQQPLAQGIVSAVDAPNFLIHIAGGQIIIDARAAEFRDAWNAPSSFAAVRPGAHIATVIIPGVYGPTTPLNARIVQILTQPLGSLTGTIEAVDIEGGTFTLLGKKVRVDEQTRMGGQIPSRDPKSVADLEVGFTVHVELNGSLDELVASRVFVHSPRPDQTIAFTGTVLSIQGNVWTIQGRETTTVFVTSLTSIDRMAVVGSMVQVRARVDAGQITATSIELYAPPRVSPPSITQTIVGILTARTAETITVNNGPATTEIFIASFTRFIDDPQVGDNVRVTVMRNGDRLSAISVEKFTGPVVFLVVGPVLEINGNTWRVGEYEVVINDATVIHGAPVVGDRVRVLGERQANGVIVARTIDKL
jgi:hypothetical protein